MSDIVGVSEYYQRVFHTQPLPATKRRRIEVLGLVLLGLEALWVVLRILNWYGILTKELMLFVVLYYALLVTICTLICAIFVKIWWWQYVSWYTPFHKTILFRIVLTINGAVAILLTNVLALILIIVLYGIVVPSLKQKRQELIRQMSNNQSAITQKEYSGTEPKDQDEEYRQNYHLVVIDKSREIYIAVIMLVVALIDVAVSLYLVGSIYTGMQALGPFSFSHVSGIYIFFSAPWPIIIYIIEMAISISRTQLLRKYNLRSHYQLAWNLHVIARVLMISLLLASATIILMAIRVIPV